MKLNHKLIIAAVILLGLLFFLLLFAKPLFGKIRLLNKEIKTLEHKISLARDTIPDNIP